MEAGRKRGVWWRIEDSEEVDSWQSTVDSFGERLRRWKKGSQAIQGTLAADTELEV